MANRGIKSTNSDRFYFLGLQNYYGQSPCLLLGRKAMTNLDRELKSRVITLPTKVCILKLWFLQQDVWIWDLDHEELKNLCFQFVVLEKTLQSPLDSKEIKPVNPKRNLPWILIGRTDAETEAPILWLPNAKSGLTGEDCDAGKDWRQKE